MREFVIEISSYSKAANPDFIIIPQNGIELISTTGEAGDELDSNYLNAIDGHGQEDLFYGYNEDNLATPSVENTYLREFLDRSRTAGNTILVTDYCSSMDKLNNSYTVNNENAFISFGAISRSLDVIPQYPNPIYNENDSSIEQLSDAKNFLYLINPKNYASKLEFIQAIKSTNYDLLIMDLFFNDGTAFSASEIEELKSKSNGGARLVVSYMSIGEAEDYRYYWQPDWNTNPPSFLQAENPNWEGNYKITYWLDEWKTIIYNSEKSYLNRILDANFDGVYLDIIDGFEYFED